MTPIDEESESVAEVYQNKGVKLSTSKILTANVNTKQQGWTPLMWAVADAASDTNGAMVQQLISAGANLHIIDGLGRSALHIAAGGGNLKAVELLSQRDHSLLSGRTHLGETPLMLAAESDRSDIVRLMVIHYGCDTHATCLRGETAIDKALRFQAWSSYRVLVGNAKDSRFLSANSESKPSDVNLLYVYNMISNGRLQPLLNNNLGVAELNSRIRMSRTLLMCAAASRSSGGTKCVQHLLRRGAEVTLVDDTGCSAMHLAALSNNLETVRLLHFADTSLLNMQTKLGDTPLMCAARNNHGDMARLLINLGASLTLRDRFGRTASDAAKDFRCWNAYRVIKEADREKRQN